MYCCLLVLSLIEKLWKLLLYDFDEDSHLSIHLFKFLVGLRIWMWLKLIFLGFISKFLNGDGYFNREWTKRWMAKLLKIFYPYVIGWLDEDSIVFMANGFWAFCLARGFLHKQVWAVKTLKVAVRDQMYLKDLVKSIDNATWDNLHSDDLLFIHLGIYMLEH